MATWIYNRPPAKCDETEFRVAQLLNRLSDDGLIRWGYYYDTDREGDFLVFGPNGGLLVVEVKGGPMRKLEQGLVDFGQALQGGGVSGLVLVHFDERANLMGFEITICDLKAAVSSSVS